MIDLFEIIYATKLKSNKKTRIENNADDDDDDVTRWLSRIVIKATIQLSYHIIFCRDNNKPKDTSLEVSRKSTKITSNSNGED